MNVRNLNGTSDNTCRCISWLEHWKKYSRSNAVLTLLGPTCSVAGCNATAEVGGHVQKDGLFDTSWYITPLCKGHNAMHGMPLILDDNTALASANVSMTCGR